MRAQAKHFQNRRQETDEPGVSAMAQSTKAPFNQWVETANSLGRQSASSVACPCCGSTSLSVRDVEYGFGHDRGVQRYISCGHCGAFTGVAVRHAGEVESPTLRAAE
ncbi:hypothetical protein T281_06340 [Rhodomicrobium udaipurense JA643]|nr:hypothetical protein T281_06340 [Rhodomicrobium udaipurense JA643]